MSLRIKFFLILFFYLQKINKQQILKLRDLDTTVTTIDMRTKGTITSLSCNQNGNYQEIKFLLNSGFLSYYPPTDVDFYITFGSPSGYIAECRIPQINNLSQGVVCTTKITDTLFQSGISIAWNEQTVKSISGEYSIRLPLVYGKVSNECSVSEVVTNYNTNTESTSESTSSNNNNNSNNNNSNNNSNNNNSNNNNSNNSNNSNNNDNTNTNTNTQNNSNSTNTNTNTNTNTDTNTNTNTNNNQTTSTNNTQSNTGWSSASSYTYICTLDVSDIDDATYTIYSNAVTLFFYATANCDPSRLVGIGFYMTMVEPLYGYHYCTIISAEDDVAEVKCTFTLSKNSYIWPNSAYASSNSGVYFLISNSKNNYFYLDTSCEICACKNDGDSCGLSDGAIVAIIIGCVIVVALIIGIIYFCFCRNKGEEDNNNISVNNTTSNNAGEENKDNSNK